MSESLHPAVPEPPLIASGSPPTPRVGRTRLTLQLSESHRALASTAPRLSVVVVVAAESPG